MTRLTGRTLKLFAAAELAAFLGLFGIYVKTNRDPEFRYRLYKEEVTRSLILEQYYALGEVMNSELKVRELDLILWKSQGKELISEGDQ